MNKIPGNSLGNVMNQMSDVTLNELLNIFKAFSDETRICILNLLFHQKLYVCEISRLLHFSNSTISSHLHILIHAGLVSTNEEGRWVRCQINRRPTYPYSRQLLELCERCLKINTSFERDLADIEKINLHDICRKKT